MLSAATCTEPSVPEVVARQLRIFTFVSPRTFAMCASVPGRFSQATVSCFTLGMAGTPKSWLPGMRTTKFCSRQGGESRTVRAEETGDDVRLRLTERRFCRLVIGQSQRHRV